jgi:glutamine synthetase
MTSCGNDNGWEVVGGFGMGQVMTTAHGNRRLTRPPTNHFKRLVEEACLNHAYPVKNKHKDCGMM